MRKTNHLIIYSSVEKFTQNIISVRFLEVLDELIDQRHIDNVADFCRKISYPPQSMSQIKLGRRDVTIDLISILFNRFNGNPLYVLSGKGSKILKPETLTMAEEQIATYGKGDLKPVIQSLEELVSAKNQIILLLQKDNHRLETELKRIKQ